jgi:hypothetical protein
MKMSILNEELVKQRRQAFVDSVASLQDQLRRECTIQLALDPLIPKLTESATLYPGGGSFLAYVYNREDLQVLMRLSPVWHKRPSSRDGIYYIADPENNEHKVSFTIYAKEGALPPTCKVEEITEFQPAVPERIIRRSVVKCNFTTSDNDETP